MGKNVEMGYFVVVDSLFPHLVTIGEGSTVVKGAVILAHDRAREKTGSGKMKVAPTVLGRRSFIGANAVIMPGVKIGDGAVVGAGAVVTKDVAPGTIVAGVPAKPIH